MRMVVFLVLSSVAACCEYSDAEVPNLRAFEYRAELALAGFWPGDEVAFAWEEGLGPGLSYREPMWQGNLQLWTTDDLEVAGVMMRFQIPGIDRDAEISTTLDLGAVGATLCRCESGLFYIHPLEDTLLCRDASGQGTGAQATCVTPAGSAHLDIVPVECCNDRFCATCAHDLDVEVTLTDARASGRLHLVMDAGTAEAGCSALVNDE